MWGNSNPLCVIIYSTFIFYCSSTTIRWQLQDVNTLLHTPPKHIAHTCYNIWIPQRIHGSCIHLIYWLTPQTKVSLFAQVPWLVQLNKYTLFIAVSHRYHPYYRNASARYDSNRIQLFSYFASLSWWIYINKNIANFTRITDPVQRARPHQIWDIGLPSNRLIFLCCSECEKSDSNRQGWNPPQPTRVPNNRPFDQRKDIQVSHFDFIACPIVPSIVLSF